MDSQNQKEIAGVAEQFNAGRLNRRTAIQRLLKLGVSAPSAYMALGLIGTSTEAQNIEKLNEKDLEAKARQIIRLGTSKEVVDLLRKSKSSANYSDVKVAEQLIQTITKPEMLKSAGFNPEGLRLSLRVFEKDAKSSSERTLAIAQNIKGKQLVHLRGTNNPPQPISESELRSEFGSDVIMGLPISEVTYCASIGAVVCVSVGN